VIDVVWNFKVLSNKPIEICNCAGPSRKGIGCQQILEGKTKYDVKAKRLYIELYRKGSKVSEHGFSNKNGDVYHDCKRGKCKLKEA